MHGQITQCFPWLLSLIQGFPFQTPSTPFLLLFQIVNIIAMAETLASQEKVPKSLLSWGLWVKGKTAMKLADKSRL